MPDSKYFGIPFATSGDRATIPEASQPSGSISMTQGFGPDYERDPATDPAAKRVPRDETNEFYFQVSNAIKFLQLYGVPEWYASDDAGNPVSYPINARVRRATGGVMRTYVSLVANNTTPPALENSAQWALEEAFSFTALEATLAESVAGLIGGKVITPRRLSAAVQGNAWLSGSAGGTANALTLTLSPAPASLAAILRRPLVVAVTTTNTGAATLNLNGLGAASIRRGDGSPVLAGDLLAGTVVTVIYDGANFVLQSGSRADRGGFQSFTSNGSFTVPAGVNQIYITVWGAGGGGGGASGSSLPSSGAGGGGGGYAAGSFRVTPGQVIPITVGVRGTGGGVSGAGATGGTSSAGSLISATGGGGGSAGINGNGTTSGGGGGGIVPANQGWQLTGGGGGFGLTSGGNIGGGGGIGGHSPFGGPSPTPNMSADGSVGLFPGGGGNGGSTTAGGARLGGDGANGLVVIEF